MNANERELTPTGPIGGTEAIPSLLSSLVIRVYPGLFVVKFPLVPDTRLPLADAATGYWLLATGYFGEVEG